MALSAAAVAHRSSAAGLQSGEAAATFPTTPTTPDLLREYKWRFFAERLGQDVPLTNVESVTWDEGGSSGAITTGTITVRDPAYGLGPQITVDEGDQIRCEVDGGGGFLELWTMRIASPDVTVKAAQRTFQLANDLDLLNRSDDDFLFAAGKGTAHPNGWTVDQIILSVCLKYGVKVGAVPVGQYRRRKSWSWRAYSPLRAIQEALNTERQHTGRRFVVRWTAAALWITPLQRNPSLLGLGPSLIDAELQSHLPAGENTSGINEGYFASAVTMRGLRNEPVGKDKQGRDKVAPHKMEVYVPSPASIARFGYVHRIVWSGDAKEEADLGEEALQYLAAVAKPIKEVTLTHIGIPGIRLGDAMKIGVGDAALQNQIVWVSEISYTLSPSDFTMVLTVTFDDPYLDKVAEMIQSRVADTIQGAQQIANHLKPKVAKARAEADTVTGSQLPGYFGGDSAAALDAHTGVTIG